MDKKIAIEVAKPLFESHKGVDTFFITSDKQAFFADHHAANHARETIKDKVVFKVSRDEAIEPVELEHTANEALGVLQNTIVEENAKQLSAADAIDKAKTEDDKTIAQAKLDEATNSIADTRDKIEAHENGTSTEEKTSETTEPDPIEALTKAMNDAEAIMKEKEAAIEGTAGIVKTNATRAFNKAKALYDVAKAALEVKQTELEESTVVE